MFGKLRSGVESFPADGAAWHHYAFAALGDGRRFINEKFRSRDGQYRRFCGLSLCCQSRRLLTGSRCLGTTLQMAQARQR
jgi:hypothetical protein